MVECQRFPYKVVYPTKAKANKVARKMRSPKKGHLGAFECGNHWHIGRKDKKAKRSGQKIAIEDWLSK